MSHSVISFVVGGFFFTFAPGRQHPGGSAWPAPTLGFLEPFLCGLCWEPQLLVESSSEAQPADQICSSGPLHHNPQICSSGLLEHHMDMMGMPRSRETQMLGAAMARTQLKTEDRNEFSTSIQSGHPISQDRDSPCENHWSCMVPQRQSSCGNFVRTCNEFSKKNGRRHRNSAKKQWFW